MKFRVDINDNTCEIETACTMAEMCACLTAVVNSLYERLGGEAGEAFKYAITEAFKDGLPFKPQDEVKAEAKKAEAKNHKKVDGLIEALKALRGLIEEDEDEAE